MLRDSAKSMYSSRNNRKTDRQRANNTTAQRLSNLYICLILVQLLAPLFVVTAFDFDWADCPDNEMRKPPRFGKRAGGSNEYLGWNIESGGMRLVKRNIRSPCFRGLVRRRTSTQPYDPYAMKPAKAKVPHEASDVNPIINDHDFFEQFLALLKKLRLSYRNPN